MITNPKLEERYIVLKILDLKAADALLATREFLRTNGIKTVDCVVVEADWPQYSAVVDMIIPDAASPVQGPDVVAWLVHEHANEFNDYRSSWRATTFQPKKHARPQPLMTVSQHKRILAAQPQSDGVTDIEPFPPTSAPEPGWDAGYEAGYNDAVEQIKVSAAQLQTQPIHPKPIGYIDKKDLARLRDEVTWDGSHLRIGVDHFAQWLEDTPYDHLVPIYAEYNEVQK